VAELAAPVARVVPAEPGMPERAARAAAVGMPAVAVPPVRAAFPGRAAKAEQVVLGCARSPASSGAHAVVVRA
jgi:hypothetical protein